MALLFRPQRPSGLRDLTESWKRILNSLVLIGIIAGWTICKEIRIYSYNSLFLIRAWIKIILMFSNKRGEINQIEYGIKDLTQVVVWSSFVRIVFMFSWPTLVVGMPTTVQLKKVHYPPFENWQMMYVKERHLLIECCQKFQGPRHNMIGAWYHR